ncbi:hypothetical protein [Ignicoccus islandicus]|uniref:hypothetical protein n=1 Tax=Ignicoccus islandicus TaxID=54259 RepID=UPI0012EE46EA|nr:hypothetical protein [Ignicoccus islandicus]
MFFRHVLSRGLEEELDRADERIEEFVAVHLLDELSKLTDEGPSKYILYKVIKDNSKKLFLENAKGYTLEETLSQIFGKIGNTKIRKEGNQIVIEMDNCPLANLRNLNPQRCMVPIAMLAGLVEAETGKKVKAISPAGKFGLASAEVNVEVTKCGSQNGSCEIRISGI